MNKLIDNTVYQSNEILQRGISTLSTQATKILMMAISSIEAEDEPSKVYTLKLSDIINCLGTHYDGKIIADIKKCFDDIKAKPFWLQTNSTTEVQCSFFQKVWCIKDTDGTRFEVLFDSDCKPFLFGLKRNFTSYCLEDVLKMGSKFSIRLYGMLKSYLHTDSNGWEIIVKVDELKELLNATAKSYNNFNLFEEKVLSKAVKEINDLTNINVGYIKAKTGRKITSILFHNQMEVWEKLIVHYQGEGNPSLFLDCISRSIDKYQNEQEQAQPSNRTEQKDVANTLV